VPGFFAKWRGLPGAQAPQRPPLGEVALGFLGGLIAISLLGAVHYEAFVLRGESYHMLVTSFAATSTMLFALPNVPLAQPRSVAFGHLIGALVGVAFRELDDLVCGEDCLWITAGLAAGTTIALMGVAGVIHPPGCATTLAAVMGDANVRRIGFLYVLVPVLSGVVIMLTVALVFNNLWSSRRYPMYW
jgi:CBS domain-containing membrane protein